jgi:hypothetical protein
MLPESPLVHPKRRKLPVLLTVYLKRHMLPVLLTAYLKRHMLFHKLKPVSALFPCSNLINLKVP